jgi:hypothetical protein
LGVMLEESFSIIHQGRRSISGRGILMIYERVKVS